MNEHMIVVILNANKKKVQGLQNVFQEVLKKKKGRMKFMMTINESR